MAPELQDREQTWLIPFTQYFMPLGRKQQEQFECDDEEVYKKAADIIAQNLRFECEMLSDYRTVSFTITGYHPEAGEEQDLAIKTCKNGPEVPNTIKAMIREFDLEGYKIRNA